MCKKVPKPRGSVRVGVVFAACHRKKAMVNLHRKYVQTMDKSPNLSKLC